LKKLQLILGLITILFLAGCSESNSDLIYFADADYVVEFLNADHTRSSIADLGFEVSNLGAYDRVIENPEFEEWRLEGTTFGPDGLQWTSLRMTNNEPRTIRITNTGNPQIQRAIAPERISEDYFSEIRFHYDIGNLVSIEFLGVRNFHGIDWFSLSTWELEERLETIYFLNSVYNLEAEEAPQGMNRSIVFEIENVLFQVRTRENMPATIETHILEETRAEREARIAERLSRQLGIDTDGIIRRANRAPDLNGTYRNVNIASHETYGLGNGVRVEVIDLYLARGMEFPRMLIYYKDNDAYPSAVVFQALHSTSTAQNGRNNTLKRVLLERVWDSIQDEWLFGYVLTQHMMETYHEITTFNYIVTPDITRQMLESWLALTPPISE